MKSAGCVWITGRIVYSVRSVGAFVPSDMFYVCLHKYSVLPMRVGEKTALAANMHV